MSVEILGKAEERKLNEERMTVLRPSTECYICHCSDILYGLSGLAKGQKISFTSTSPLCPAIPPRLLSKSATV
jgi:hypothetical protein